MPETNEYDDIINLPHHVSATHPQMTNYNRAAQFSPFAALTGYEKIINNTCNKKENKMSSLINYEEEEG